MFDLRVVCLACLFGTLYCSFYYLLYVFVCVWLIGLFVLVVYLFVAFGVVLLL